MKILRDNQLPSGPLDSIPIARPRAGRNSIYSEIHKLTDETNPPEAFVSMVCDTFKGMGISLHEHAGPYRFMLESLFKRELKLRKDRDRVRAYLQRIRKILGQKPEERPLELRNTEVLHRMWHGLEARSKQLTTDISNLREQLKSLSASTNAVPKARWGVRSVRL